MRSVTLALFACLLLAASCSQYHYSPNFVQTPYIEKKGDGVITAAVSGSPVSINGDFHVSYSPVKHGILMLNYFRNRSSFENQNFFGGPTLIQSARGQLIEGAAGTYRPLAFGTGAVYVGYGQGKMRNDYGIQRIANLRLQRFFIQPTFTFKNDWFRFGVGVRVVRLNYPSGNIDYRIEPSDIAIIQRLESESPFWFPEFGGNIGVHFKPVTFSANLVIVASSRASDYGFDGSNAGVGISVELQELFKKGKKKTAK